MTTRLTRGVCEEVSQSLSSELANDFCDAAESGIRDAAVSGIHDAASGMASASLVMGSVCEQPGLGIASGYDEPQGSGNYDPQDEPQGSGIAGEVEISDE